MKHKTMAQLRDEDFVDCLRRAIKRHSADKKPSTSSQIIAEALASQPRRYYLSYSTIESGLGRLRNDGYFNRRSDRMTYKRWLDINAAVNRYLARNKQAKLTDAISHVVNFGRPTRFYISDKKARELFRRVARRDYRVIG